MYITRYSIEPKNKFYVRDYGFLSFAKKNTGKSLSSNCGQNILHSSIKLTTDATKLP